MASVCLVCEKNVQKYKCPTCTAPYCSVTCCKKHKESGCKQSEIQENNSNLEKTSKIVQKEYEFPTEDTVPIEKLQELRNSEEVRRCLQNPHVRDIMSAILNDPNPTKAIALAMTEPIFVELADAFLKVIEPLNHNIPV